MGRLESWGGWVGGSERMELGSKGFKSGDWGRGGQRSWGAGVGELESRVAFGRLGSGGVGVGVREVGGWVREVGVRGVGVRGVGSGVELGRLGSGGSGIGELIGIGGAGSGGSWGQKSWSKDGWSGVEGVQVGSGGWGRKGWSWVRRGSIQELGSRWSGELGGWGRNDWSWDRRRSEGLGSGVGFGKLGLNGWGQEGLGMGGSGIGELIGIRGAGVGGELGSKELE